MDQAAICVKTENHQSTVTIVARLRWNILWPPLMPETTQHAADPATVALYEVAQRIDALTEAWKGDALPPNLAEFVPQGPAGLRRLVLSELIKVDLEERWRQHERPKQVAGESEEYTGVAQNG